MSDARRIDWLTPPVRMGPLSLYWLGLVVPAAPSLLRYSGWAGLIGYVVISVFLLPWLLRLRLDAWWSRRTLTFITIFMIAVLATLFVFIYPIADQGLTGGSDSDDAIDVGIREMVGGRHPYAATTYLGNYLGPMPGAFFLGYPFWLVFGGGAYQNIFQLIIFVLVMRCSTRDAALPLTILAISFALSLAFIHDFLTGSDRFANAIVVLTGFVITIRTCGRGRWSWGLSCVYLGLGLSWRIPYILAAPILFAGLVQRAGWRRAFTSAIIIGGAFLLVTLPFYLYDPASFPALRGEWKITQYDALVPFGSTVVKTIAVIGAALLALHHSNRDDYGLFRNVALSQMLLVFGAGLLQFVATGGSDIKHFSYGSFFSFFATFAAILAINQERSSMAREFR